MGDKCVQHEFMEEDFFYINDDEEDLFFDPNSTRSSHISLPDYYENEQMLKMLREVQLQQAELKKKVFEATECTIVHNKRAHIHKMKRRNYTTGQIVLFCNPNGAGLASTLNVRGKVTEKIGGYIKCNMTIGT